MNYSHREEGWKESKSIIYRNKHTKIRDTSLRSQKVFLEDYGLEKFQVMLWKLLRNFSEHGNHYKICKYFKYE